MLSDKQIREIDYWAGTYWNYSWKAGGSMLMLFLVAPLIHFFWGGIQKGAWATFGIYASTCGIALSIHQILYWRRRGLVRRILADGQPALARVVEFTIPTNSEYRLKIVTERETDQGPIRTTHSLMAWHGMKEFRPGDTITLLCAGSNSLIAEYFVTPVKA